MFVAPLSRVCSRYMIHAMRPRARCSIVAPRRSCDGGIACGRCCCVTSRHCARHASHFECQSLASRTAHHDCQSRRTTSRQHSRRRNVVFCCLIVAAQLSVARPEVRSLAQSLAARAQQRQWQAHQEGGQGSSRFRSPHHDTQCDVIASCGGLLQDNGENSDGDLIVDIEPGVRLPSSNAHEC